jgi:hypothetical protein
MMTLNMELEEKEILLQILKDQIRRHPGFYVEDLYKLIFQVTCGGSHLLENHSEVEKSLQDEWNNTERIPKGETLLEVIDPRSEVIRINIRVYKKISGKRDILHQIFIQSAQSFRKDHDRLIRYWEMILDMAGKNEIPFSKEILEDFLIEQGEKKFPAIHHSKAYIDWNRPSYRVVLKKLWEGFVCTTQNDRK